MDLRTKFNVQSPLQLQKKTLAGHIEGSVSVPPGSSTEATASVGVTTINKEASALVTPGMPTPKNATELLTL